MGIGDWGLGIGPIPNPQSPIPKYSFYNLILLRLKCFKVKNKIKSKFNYKQLK